VHRGWRIASEPELQVRLRTDAAVIERLPIFEQLPTGRVNVLLVEGDAFSHQDYFLHARNITGARHTQTYGPAGDGLHKELHRPFAVHAAGGNSS
jgi:hypothetical protein